MQTPRKEAHLLVWLPESEGVEWCSLALRPRRQPGPHVATLCGTATIRRRVHRRGLLSGFQSQSQGLQLPRRRYDLLALVVASGSPHRKELGCRRGPERQKAQECQKAQQCGEVGFFASAARPTPVLP